MPVYAADVLPDTTGRNLGSPPQRWNGFIHPLDVQGSLNYQPVSGANLGPSGVVYVSTTSVKRSSQYHRCAGSFELLNFCKLAQLTRRGFACLWWRTVWNASRPDGVPPIVEG